MKEPVYMSKSYIPLAHIYWLFVSDINCLFGYSFQFFQQSKHKDGRNQTTED